MSNLVTPQLYLASASPRRQELLTQIGIHFAVLPQQVDESVRPQEAPVDYVIRIAIAKAQAALSDPQRLLALPIVSADTSVILEGEIFGKPSSLEAATTMLSRLSGKTHQVLTAIVVCEAGLKLQANSLHQDREKHQGREKLQDQKCRHLVVSTDVSFRALRHTEIQAYWDSGEPQDKAGAYAIQGRAAMFVENMRGSYSNVVGLPLFETAQLLNEIGISSTSLLAGT